MCHRFYGLIGVHVHSSFVHIGGDGGLALGGIHLDIARPVLSPYIRIIIFDGLNDKSVRLNRRLKLSMGDNA